MILFIDATVRSDSRTKRLAHALLDTLSGDIETVRLEEISFAKVDEEFLNVRDALILSERFDDEMFDLARQFAQADEIVIAAPYWDLSFPSTLKQYVEQINVTGITFCYSPEGIPQGLCKARKLYYVMTAGGGYCPEEFGYGYIKALSNGFYGIDETRLITATGLDVFGNDPEQIIKDAIDGLESLR